MAKQIIKTYSPNFNIDTARKLRDAVNEKDNLSIEKTLNNVNVWNQICAIMDRLEDTLTYLNDMELGCCQNRHYAFDFYDFINNASVVIDCIEQISKIFGVNKEKLEHIKNSQEVFGNVMEVNGTDYEYFKYIRSICAVHPINTNNSKHPYLNHSKYQVCPFVVWCKGPLFDNLKGDLCAYIYGAEKNTILLSLYVKQFCEYIEKWIAFIPEIINAIKQYNNSVYEKYRNEKLKNIQEFDEIPDYIEYLKSENSKRFGYNINDIFDFYIDIFKTKISNTHNIEKCEKYKNAILYSLNFVHNSLQNMETSGFDNTGIKYEHPNIESDLFCELRHCYMQNEDFSPHTYAIGKMHYFYRNNDYDYYEKKYARSLLDEMKDVINKYVIFTNEESDDETVLLINTAFYLSALDKKCLVGMNIPNTQDYREKILTEDEYNELIKPIPIPKYDETEITFKIIDLELSSLLEE